MIDEPKRQRMSKTANRLTPKKIARLKEPGRYHDGYGLMLQVTKTGAKSWLLRYQRDGREHMHGLGPLQTVSLKEARERATAARLKVLDGIDPIDIRRVARRQRKLDEAKAATFQQVADQLQAKSADEWGEVHRSQWRNTMRDYVYPIIGDLPVADIDIHLVVKVLEPIWKTKQTAQRLRERIARVLDHAEALGLRTGKNPASLTEHLKHLLGKPVTVARHHAAMPFDDIPQFMEELRTQEGVAARALEVTILTALRTGEAINATWDEIDLVKRQWIIPAARMKTAKKIGEDHDVPLSDRVIEILNELPREDGNPFVFIGRAGQPIGIRAMFALLQTMRPNLTVHGLRSSFRTWAAVRTNFQREVCEQALAHTLGNATERAYMRDKLSEKRRALISDWASYCANVSNVVPLKKSS